MVGNSKTFLTLDGKEYMVERRHLGSKAEYVAYEKSSYMGNHSSLYSTEEGVWGRIMSRFLPEEIEALKPMSDERGKAVEDCRAINRKDVWKVVTRAFSHLEWKGGFNSFGDVEEAL